MDLLIGGSALARAFAIGALVVVAWLGWRKPTAFFALALLSLAVRPEAIFGASAVGTEWVVQHWLIVAALLLNAVRYGVRAAMNWPIATLAAVVVFNLLFSDLNPKLTIGYMLGSWLVLVLPWTFVQVVLEPGSRRFYGMTIALTPLLSVAIGVVLHLFSVAPVVQVWESEYRLQGAIGDPLVLALLAFTGFAVCLHECTRPRRRYAGYVAVVNLGILILTGARMGIVASVVLFAVYYSRSEALRHSLLRHPAQVFLGVAAIVATISIYFPSLQHRLLEGDGATLRLSGRDEMWSFYYNEFLLSPVFGRGVGAGFVAGRDWLEFGLTTPHNEYLHILVIGGVVGFCLVLAAIVTWYRWLVRTASPNDRDFLLALIPAFAIYSVTDNTLVYTSTLALFAYLGTLLTRPALDPAAGQGCGQKQAGDAPFGGPVASGLHPDPVALPSRPADRYR